MRLKLNAFIPFRPTKEIFSRSIRERVFQHDIKESRSLPSSLVEEPKTSSRGVVWCFYNLTSSSELDFIMNGRTTGSEWNKSEAYCCQEIMIISKFWEQPVQINYDR